METVSDDSSSLLRREKFRGASSDVALWDVVDPPSESEEEEEGQIDIGAANSAMEFKQT